MTGYRLVSAPRADLDVEAAFEWYENERSALGREFLDELRATYDRIAAGPLKYQLIRSGIRRALLRRRTLCTSQLKGKFLSSLPFSTRVAIPPSGSGDEANQAMEPTGMDGAARRRRRCAGGSSPMR